MSLHILIGPMFAGKSSRVADIVSRYSALGSQVLLINHADDVRFGGDHVTHNNRKTPCLSVRDLHDIPNNVLANADVIVVDEAQFFSSLVGFCEHVVDTLEKKVYLVGLDGDSERRPFGDVLNCIPLADTVEKIHALCARCANGTPGICTWRNSNVRDQKLVGGADHYDALCRECYMHKLLRA